MNIYIYIFFFFFFFQSECFCVFEIFLKVLPLRDRRNLVSPSTQ
jgi:hypothetical protein